MSEETEPKYASEASAFIRLFRAEKHSVVGLIVAELIWGYLLFTATKLGGEHTGVPVIVIPQPTFSWPLHRWIEVSTKEVFVLGGLAILVAWAFYGPFIKWLSGAVLLAWRAFLSLVFFASAFVMLLIDVLLMPITIPVEIRRLPKLLREHREKWIQERAKGSQFEGQDASKTQEELDKSYDKWVKRQEAIFGKRFLREAVLENVRFKVLCILLNFLPPLGRLLQTSFTGVRIAIAPLALYAETGNSVSGSVLLPGLLDAWRLLRERFAHFKCVRGISLVVLPARIAIHDPLAARRICKIFQLDALIWGSVQRDTARLSLHMPTTGVQSNEEDDRYDLAVQWKMFPNRECDFILPLTTTETSKDGATELYIFLLAAVLQALQYRVRKRERLIFQEFPVSSGRRALRDILLHLVFDVFRVLPDEPLNESLPRSAAAQLTDIVSSWAGRQLCTDETSNDHAVLWESDIEQCFARQLCEVLRKCTRIAPYCAEHFFRLGAIACYLGNKQLALEAFHKAGQLIATGGRVSSYGARVIASNRLKEAESGSGRQKKFAMAVFAAHAAYVLSVGDELAFIEIRKKLNASWAWQDIQFQKQLGKESEAATAFDVVEQLLADNGPAQSSLTATV
jgi:hypothetical protein